jgi:hypothetical protein
VDTAEVGVTEKALAVALTVHRVRQEMFRQVYWHHTVRALKAMLGYVVRSTLVRLRQQDREEPFWETIAAFVVDARIPRSSFRGEPPASSPAPAATVPAWLDEPLTDAGAGPAGWQLVGGLSQTDSDLLELLSSFAEGPAATMLHWIRTRTLYRRVGVMSLAREPDSYRALYSEFATYRHRENLEEIERLRRRCEDSILAKLDEKTAGLSVPLVSDEMTRIEPKVLLDIPIKALKRQWEKRPLFYVPEDFAGVRGRVVGSVPIIDGAPAEVEGDQFDMQVGKIRVFAHPQWHGVLASQLTNEDMLEVLRR